MTTRNKLQALPFSIVSRPLVLATFVALGLAGCDKEKEGTESPDQATPAQQDGAQEAAADPAGLPEQDPDPAELAAALQDYEQGNYDAVKSAMEGLLPQLEGDTKVRANIIANAWFAMAVAEEFPENARDHVDTAMANVDRLGDPEAEQIARLARGAYLIGVAEFNEAETELAKAESLEGPGKELALLLHAQAILNQAFDENDRIQDPAKLDVAAKSYQAVLDTSEAPTIKGRAEAGLAAISNFKNAKDEVCTHATAAAEHYEAGNASDYLKEVPSLLKSSAKCK